MNSFNKIDCNDIKIGMRFSAPVFFEDGENMFLAEEKSIKAYHLEAIQRWHIKYLLTYGKPVTDSEINSPDSVYLLEDVDEVEEFLD